MTKCEVYEEKEELLLDNDEKIWQILSDCGDAKLDDTSDFFERENRRYLDFTATSEALGVYNRVVYISEDGYFATNIFDYEYSYFIGKEAAGQIISYIQKHSTETKSSTSLPTISGTVTDFERENRRYLDFTATSEALGVYNRVVYISEDGYFATNIFDYEYSYFIGKEAAGQIISYIQKHSTETKSSTSLPTISGTVTEIGNGYIMVDDTILCRKSKAGKKYKVYTDDIKVRRWIESGEVKAGDLVAVEYEGEISNDYEVKGAYSIFTGTLEENGILNQE